MRVFTVHLHPSKEPELVREGWSWGACLFGAVWFAFQAAWIPAVLWLALSSVPLLLAPGPGLVMAFALAILAGLIGRDLVRWSLDRRGYVLAHVVAAGDRDSAYARLLAAREDQMPRILAGALPP